MLGLLLKKRGPKASSLSSHLENVIKNKIAPHTVHIVTTQCLLTGVGQVKRKERELFLFLPREREKEEKL